MHSINLSDLSMLREFYDIGAAIFYSKAGSKIVIGCYERIDGKDYIATDDGKYFLLVLFSHAVKISDFRAHFST